MIKDNLKNIECIAYDFDGVMTDNKVLVTEDGKEAVFCNRSDGLAISRFKSLGINQIIISTEKNPVVGVRAEKLGVNVVNGVTDKGALLLRYCQENGISTSNVLFIGNDVNDLSAFQVAGLTGAPADAEPEVLRVADWVSKRNGGDGVIRELYTYYLDNVTVDEIMDKRE